MKAPSPAVRAAIAAGVTAGLTFGIIANSANDSVRVESASTAGTIPEATTPSTEATTTTAALALPERVEKVEQRVTILEATTTTTTPVPVAAPTVNLKPSTVIDGVVNIPVMYFNHQDARSLATFPNGRVRIAVTIAGVEQEIVAPLPASESGTFMIPVPNADATTGQPVPARAVATEWDGGMLPGGAGQLTKP